MGTQAEERLTRELLATIDRLGKAEVDLDLAHECLAFLLCWIEFRGGVPPETSPERAVWNQWYGAIKRILPEIVEQRHRAQWLGTSLVVTLGSDGTVQGGSFSTGD